MGREKTTVEGNKIIGRDSGIAIIIEVQRETAFQRKRRGLKG